MNLENQKNQNRMMKIYRWGMNLKSLKNLPNLMMMIHTWATKIKIIKLTKFIQKRDLPTPKKETRGRPKSNQVDKDESLNIKNTKEGSKRKRAETDNNMDDDDYNDDY